MHVVVGIAGFLAVLVATIRLEEIDRSFAGLFYRPALLLLLAAPPFVALISHDLRELGQAARDVLRALRSPPHRARAALVASVARFGEEMRRGRAGAALQVADESRDELFRLLAPLSVKRYSGEELERTAAASAAATHSRMRRSADVLTGLARVAPATGLVGTTLGLISLLRELHNFEQLGPSMALALLCTFYGLILANAVYQPLARLVHVRAQAEAEDARLLTRALTMIGEDKPLADVRALFGPTSGQQRAAPALAAE